MKSLLWSSTGRRSLAVAILWLLAVGTTAGFAADPIIYLMRESGGSDLLLKYEDGVLSTVGGTGFAQVRVSPTAP